MPMAERERLIYPRIGMRRSDIEFLRTVAHQKTCELGKYVSWSSLVRVAVAKWKRARERGQEL